MSNLPPLRWRLGATPIKPPTSGGVDVIATLKTQVQGLQYWKLIETPNSGSGSLLLAPNATFSTSSNMNVVVAFGASGSSMYRSPDTAASVATRMVVGLTPDILGTADGTGSGSYRGLQFDRPFQSATGNPRWSGYWYGANLNQVSASFILESEDSIFIGFRDNTSTSGTQGFLVGAIMESQETGSGENNFRLYGIMTCGAASFSTAFWGATIANSTNASSHMGVFAVSGGQVSGDGAWTYAFFSGQTTPVVGEQSTWPAGKVISGTVPMQVALPLGAYGATQGNAGPFRFLGTTRGWYIAEDGQLGLNRIQSSSIDQVYRVSTSWTAAPQDAFIFGPASGSGL